MFWNKYPYTDFHELNLDWILEEIKKLHEDMDEFEALNQITFDGAWDITKQYPAWTIVNDNGAGYISIRPVPAGVVLTNTDYWRGVVDYTATIADLQNRVIVLEKARAWVTPEMYGAIGDGVTDDTAAIQKAINAGNTTFKKTTYKVTSPIAVKNSRIIDLNGATLETSGTCFVINEEDAASPLKFVTIKNGSIQTNGNGIEIYNSYFIYIDTVSIHLLSSNTKGIYAENGFNNDFIRCQIYGVSDNSGCIGVDYEVTAPQTIPGITNITNVLLDSCLIQRLEKGVKFAGMSGGVFDTNMLVNTSFSYCTDVAIDFNAQNIRNITIKEGRCESSGLFLRTYSDAYVSIEDMKLVRNDGIDNKGFVRISGSMICEDDTATPKVVIYANTGTISFAGLNRVQFINSSIGNTSGGKILANDVTEMRTPPSKPAPERINRWYNANSTKTIADFDAPEGCQLYTYRRAGDSGWIMPDGKYTNYDYVYHFIKTSEGWKKANGPDRDYVTGKPNFAAFNNSWENVTIQKFYTGTDYTIDLSQSGALAMNNYTELYIMQRTGDNAWTLPDGTTTEANKIYHCIRLDDVWRRVF